jgi:DNA helicase II / ATP-dependent DNA helicase PcrA
VALDSHVPKAPVQTTFPPVSLGQPLVPARTIVVNSQAALLELHTSAFKSVTPTSHSAFGKLSLHHTRPSAGLSSKPPTAESHPSTSTISAGAPEVTPSPSSAEVIRLDGLQSSGGPPTLAGGKRRLGMGRSGVGYSNKKFKTPGL